MKPRADIWAVISGGASGHEAAGAWGQRDDGAPAARASCAPFQDRLGIPVVRAARTLPFAEDGSLDGSVIRLDCAMRLTPGMH